MEEAVKGKPTEPLTREQVMAQRAEKKKLKEARKNKGAGMTSENPAEISKPPAKPKNPPQQEPKKTDQEPKKSQQEGKKSPEQKKSSQGQKKSEEAVDKPSEGQKQKQKQSSKPKGAPKQSSSETPVEKENKVPGAVTSSTSKSGSAVPHPETRTPITKNASSASIAESKTSDKSTATTGKSHETGATIHSLFKVQKRDAGREKGFQPHIIFHNLAVKLKNNVIRGANSRCAELLNSMKDFVQVYKTPSGATFKHGVLKDLERNIDILRKKCPFGIGTSNAIDYIIGHIYKINENNKDVTHLKEEISNMIDQYVDEKITKAVEAIYHHGKESIQDGDIIMVYSITEAVVNLLERKAKKGTAFEIILILTPDTMPDIRLLLKNLSEPIQQRSVTISSVNFSNAIYRMRHSTKLIVGGHGLFTTGGVMAQSGSGQLALLASTFNKPALFLCETYKFCDRSPLDFFTLDEYMTDKSSHEHEWFEPKIKYDVTPANLVTVVITDIDLLPSTSVPVVLRVQEGRSPRRDDDD